MNDYRGNFYIGLGVGSGSFFGAPGNLTAALAMGVLVFGLWCLLDRLEAHLKRRK